MQTFFSCHSLRKDSRIHGTECDRTCEFRHLFGIPHVQEETFCSFPRYRLAIAKEKAKAAFFCRWSFLTAAECRIVDPLLVAAFLDGYHEHNPGDLSSTTSAIKIYVVPAGPRAIELRCSTLYARRKNFSWRGIFCNRTACKTFHVNLTFN